MKLPVLGMLAKGAQVKTLKQFRILPRLQAALQETDGKDLLMKATPRRITEYEEAEPGST